MTAVGITGLILFEEGRLRADAADATVNRGQ